MKNKFLKNRNINKQGFSLLEMIMAIFIFSLVMTTVASIFVQVFNTRKKAKEIQVNIEDSRAAMELMAKSLRMSNVRSDEADTESIVVYDYSQNKCIKYYKDSSDSRLKMMAGVMDDDGCDASYSSGTAQDMMSGVLNNFSLDVVKSRDSDPKAIGKVTIAMTICTDDKIPCKTQETIQTTVSLRDYGFVSPSN